jgi:hypothetical protein
MVKRPIAPCLFALALTAWQAGNAAAQEPAAPQGPVSYWKFEEGTGTATANAVAGAPGGTLQGGASFSPMVPPAITYPDKYSLSCNGTNAVVNVPNFGSFTAMSVSVWIYRSGSTGARQSVLSFKETGGGFVLSLNENGSSEFPRIWLNQGGWQYKEDSVAIPLNTWTHVAATYDNSNLRLYINGTEAAPATALTGNMTEPSAVIGIGARNSLDQHWYPGLIDDARIYSRALTAAEVAVLAAGCPTPTGLTAVGGASNITLNWTAPAGAAPGYTYNVKRGTASGGAYTTIAPGISGTNYVDSTVTIGTTYYYVVSAVSAAESGDCPQASDSARPVTALPNTGLFTNESGATTTFTIKFNQPAPAAGSLLTVTTSDATEGVPSAPSLVTTPVLNAGGTVIGFTYNVAAGTSSSITVLVTGIDDSIVDGPIAYQINVTASNIAIPIPPVNCTNNDNDIAGITFSRTAGLVTSEDGTSDTFSVVLNTQPFGNVSFTLTSSNTNEGTVSPTTLTFTPTAGQAVAGGTGGWDVAHVVTVTGVDDTVLDFTQYYNIVPGTLQFADTRDQAAFAAAGVTSLPIVSCANLDNEVPPTLPKVWGGGCGLLGLEGFLPILLLGLRRRR